MGMSKAAGLFMAMIGGGLFCAVAFTSVQAASAGRMKLQGAELGPFAYTHFCMTYPADCRVSGRAGAEEAVELTAERRSDLVAVNTAVNRAIVPAPHAGRGTYDTWTIASLRGDCNDYAVTKRHELLSRGWPSRALLLAEVITAWGDHHLVLVARTGEGDFVLDNLNREVRAWTAPNYAWLRAQMPDEPALWAKVVAPERQVAMRGIEPAQRDTLE